MFITKLKASLIHLGLSLILVGLIIGSIIFFFFPQLFISVTDFKEVAAIIISVDLILGPLLTFVVFKPQKESLKFDLSVIGAIQLSALFYGAYALYQVHPVFITFNVDRFTLVNARDAEPEKAVFDEYKVSKLTTGKLAFAKLPENTLELTLTAAETGKDLDQLIEYYEPYDKNIDHILSKSLDPKLIFIEENSTQKTSKFLNKYNNTLDDYAFIPLTSETKDAIIVLDKTSAKPITTLDIDPWNLGKK